MAVGRCGVVVENHVVGVGIFHNQGLVGILGHIAAELLRRQVQGTVLDEGLVRVCILFQEPILRSTGFYDFIILNHDRLGDGVAILLGKRNVVDVVAEGLRADSLPDSHGMEIGGDRLVKVEGYGLGNIGDHIAIPVQQTAVFIRVIPAHQGIALPQRTGNGAVGGEPGIGGNLCLNVVCIPGHVAAVQVEGHRIGGRVPDGVQPEVTLHGEGGWVVFSRRRPLHIHAAGAKGPALEVPFRLAVCGPIRADVNGSRDRPGILAVLVGVLIIQGKAVFFLGHLCAVGQLDGTQGHLRVRGAVVGGGHVGDDVAISVVVEVEVVGVVLGATGSAIISAVGISIPCGMIRRAICSCHVQPGAGILLLDAVGGHGVHLTGNGIVASVVLTHRIVSAVGNVIGDRPIHVGDPHQIVKGVFRHGLVVHGYQIQEVLLVCGVIVIDADLL